MKAARPSRTPWSPSAAAVLWCPWSRASRPPRVSNHHVLAVTDAELTEEIATDEDGGKECVDVEPIEENATDVDGVKEHEEGAHHLYEAVPATKDELWVQLGVLNLVYPFGLTAGGSCAVRWLRNGCEGIDNYISFRIILLV